MRLFLLRFNFSVLVRRVVGSVLFLFLFYFYFRAGYPLVEVKGWGMSDEL